MHQLEKFCQNLKSHIAKREDSTMSLLYSLCHDTVSSSVVQLSLSCLYPYHYSCLGKSISEWGLNEDKDTKKASTDASTISKILQEKIFPSVLEQHSDTPYWLLNTDVTPIYREHSDCLEDLNYVKKNNVVQRKGSAVIGIGYEASTVGISLRRENKGVGWNPPLSMLRVGSADNSIQFGGRQVKGIIESDLFKSNKKLIVNGLDSAYFSMAYLGELEDSLIVQGSQNEEKEKELVEKTPLDNLVSVIRVPSNRVVYKRVAEDAPCNQVPGKRGPKIKYGEKFKLNEAETHGKVDLEDTFEWQSAGKKTYQVQVECWEDMVIRGKSEDQTYNRPFRLVKIQLINPQTGVVIFKRPMWLSIFGKRRKELSLREIHQSYANRFDIEHFFSFGKKKLLLNSYQSCEVEHVDNWLLLVQLAYWMLYTGRSLGENQWYPWEKYNYQNQEEATPSQDKEPRILTPIQTKRSFDRIISGFENKPPIPKPRNNSSGRKKGQSPGQKPRHKVRKKAEYRAIRNSESS